MTVNGVPIQALTVVGILMSVNPQNISNYEVRNYGIYFNNNNNNIF